jgi:hypothetical protein
VLASDHLNLLFIQDNAIEKRIPRLKRPARLAVLGEHLVEEPALLVSIGDYSNRTEHDHAREDQSGVAGERATAVHGPHRSDLDANAWIALNILEEMAVVVPVCKYK